MSFTVILICWHITTTIISNIVICSSVMPVLIILALKVILLERLQGIICSVIQEPYLLGIML